MNDAPLVSVIMPVWNGARFLRDALASIRAQKYPALEILVVDDGSTDETPQIAMRPEYNARYLPFPHRGLTPTRLVGITAAQGELIAFLDSDDMWSPTKLDVQIGLLRANADTMIVNGYTQLIKLVTSSVKATEFEKWGVPVLAPSFGSALFRRAALEQLGLSGMPIDPASDLDWFLPARERGIPMLIHPDVVQYYRRHEQNMTNDHVVGKQALLYMLKNSLARRKELGHAGQELPALNMRKDKAIVKEDDV